MAVSLFFREELLNRREHNATRRDAQFVSQVCTVFSLHWWLAQKIAAARERAEELIVEIVAVSDHDDRWVLHRRVQDDATGVKGHRQTLAGSLRMPNDA